MAEPPAQDRREVLEAGRGHQGVEDLVGDHPVQVVPSIGPDHRLQLLAQVLPAVQLEGPAVGGGGVQEGEEPPLDAPALGRPRRRWPR